jgi:hypothetical protein
VLGSCTFFVDDLNTNPNYFQEADTQVLLNHASLNLASVCEANPARLACMFTDQMRGTDRQYTSYDKYNVISKDFNEIWDDIFQSGIAQALLAKQQAISEDDKIKEGIALILESYYFGEASALFGNIPFEQVNNAEDFPNPVFNDQEYIFNSIQQKLDDAIGLVNDIPVSLPVFETAGTWGQVANSLKARYYLLTKSYDKAIEAGVLAFNQPAEGLYIKHSAENFSENLFWQFEVEVRGGYLSFNNSFLQRILTAGTAEYKGNAKTDESIRLLHYVAADNVKYNTSPNGIFSIDAKFPVISYEEVQLILAESYFRTDDLDKAIEALNQVRTFWATKYNSQYDVYEESDFLDNDALLLEILVEKYVSVIGLPSFYDVNRTKNYIGVPIKNEPLTDKIPQRFLYPETEAFSNQNFPGYKNLFDPIPLNQ